jgi:outer membrane protein OmpA-like peptidoglycan-associated protein
MFAQDLKPNEFKALVNIEVTNLENSPIQNELVIFLSKDDDNEFMATTNEEGKAQLLLPKGKSYEVKYKDLIEKVKHSSFDVPGGRGKYSFDISIKFEPSDMVILKGLIFDENQVLEEGLNLELEMMLEVLSLNKKMEIQVAAHSDNSEGKEKSLEITQKQAESIKAYFVKNGISSDRIKTIGVGMDEPVGSNALPAGRESNNRIEIRVIKKYF